MRILTLVITLTAAAMAVPPDPNRGLYAIWAQDPKLAELPFIKGGQVLAQWKDVEPEEADRL